MVECPICGEALEGTVITCSNCGKEIHKKCGKKVSGDYYCKDCKKEGKKKSRYEKMAERDQAFKR